MIFKMFITDAVNFHNREPTGQRHLTGYEVMGEDKDYLNNIPDGWIEVGEFYLDDDLSNELLPDTVLGELERQEKALRAKFEYELQQIEEQRSQLMAITYVPKTS